MEDFRALTKIISDIKKISNQIISTSLPIMRSIENEESEYVKTLVEEVPELDPAYALLTLQEISLEWIKDAEPLQIEVDRFIVSGEDSFLINVDECSLLAEVWNGDAYDKSGTLGLQEFRDDLKRQLSNVNEEYLMRRAKELLTGEEETQ